MTADSRGRDVNEALIFVTGHAAIAPVDATNVITEAQLGSTDLTLPVAYQYLGLRTSDGGPEHASEAGETIEFLEAGFEAAGDGTLTVAMTLAQYNATVRKLTFGEEPDVNGVYKVRSTTPNNLFILLLESQYKSGLQTRDIGVVRVTEISRGKDERNSVNGIPVTFKWLPHELFDNAYYWHAPIEAAPAAPAAMGASTTSTTSEK